MREIDGGTIPSPRPSPQEKEKRFQRLGVGKRWIRGVRFRNGARRWAWGRAARFSLSGFLNFAFIKLIIRMIFSELGKKRYSPGE